MKKVFSRTDQVISRWIEQTQEYGRLAKINRIFFEGDTIYSYGHHCPLARIYKEQNVILINKQRYSNTTTRQKNRIHWKSRTENDYTIYEVLTLDNHEKNVEDMKQVCVNWMLRTIRARLYINYKFQMFQENISQLNNYIRIFNLQYTPVKMSDFCNEKYYVRMATLKLLGKL